MKQVKLKKNCMVSKLTICSTRVMKQGAGMKKILPFLLIVIVFMEMSSRLGEALPSSIKKLKGKVYQNLSQRIIPHNWYYLRKVTKVSRDDK